MMAMAHAGFAFLAMTKTGSTALEAAFYDHAQLTARRPPPMKHVSARSFDRLFVPVLAKYGFPRESYEVACIVREPVDWVLSWYRYRSRVGARTNPTYTGDLSFDAFADQVLSGEVVLGTTHRFVHDGRGDRMLVDRMYRYDNLAGAAAWMSDCLGIAVPDIPTVNTSPERDVTVTPVTRRRLEEHFAADVTLYEAAR